MRCKKHYTDLTSTIGVCACCLRERLVSLIASELNPSNNPSVFRSDSVDVPRRHHAYSDQLFYSTPPVVVLPATSGHKTGRVTNSKGKLKGRFIRFISFSNIFRSRNKKPIDSVSDSNFRETRGSINATSSASISASSSSWFSSMKFISSGRQSRKQNQNNNNKTICTDEVESTGSWKNTPRRTPAVRRGGSGGHVRNNSGLAFCLSPLVRASPNLQWNDAVLSGEIGAPVKAHLAYTKSFCANRSRKMVDFGRSNPNR